ncbi:hypothetical protein PoB_005882700 [Plakobranchus ocellatus]|uniref:Uncharacterized protein n=1 Tax=Plakobranchus ocellatus TaxID=259542 RepID=A0AAV4CKQ6_9GAST|nr:hypothetical protein PoB_005882700 [Plakobranchus ocellatus]
MGAISHFDPKYFMVNAYFSSEQNPFLHNEFYLGFYFLTQVRFLAKVDWRTDFQYPCWGIFAKAGWRTGFRYPWWGILAEADWSTGFSSRLDGTKPIT